MSNKEKWLEAATAIEIDIERLKHVAALFKENAIHDVAWPESSDVEKMPPNVICGSQPQPVASALPRDCTSTLAHVEDK